MAATLTGDFGAASNYNPHWPGRPWGGGGTAGDRGVKVQRVCSQLHVCLGELAPPRFTATRKSANHGSTLALAVAFFIPTVNSVRAPVRPTGGEIGCAPMKGQYWMIWFFQLAAQASCVAKTIRCPQCRATLYVSKCIDGKAILCSNCATTFREQAGQFRPTGGPFEAIGFEALSDEA